MTSITHPELVRALAKPGADIITSLTPVNMHLLHMVVGVCGEVAETIRGIMNRDRENIVEELGDTEFYLEGIYDVTGIQRTTWNPHECGMDTELFAVHAGELLDAVKKAAIYNKPLDYSNLAVALASLEQQMQAVRNMFTIGKQETIDHNIAKLSKRYASGGYSDAQAQARADKVEEQGELFGGKPE